MYKNKFVNCLLVAVPVLVLITMFQNCSASQQAQDNFSNMISAPTVDQIHRDPTAVTDKVSEVPQSFMDRLTLYSLFADIFGPNSTQLVSLNQIKNERNILGGPCSIYDNFNSVKDTGMVSMDSKAITCANTETSNTLAAPIQPAANVLHQALITNICNEAITNANTYKYMSAQLKENAQVLVPANTPENILKLFSLFYRGKPMPEPQLIESLSYLIGQPATDSSWKTAILITCVSSHWQSL